MSFVEATPLRFLAAIALAWLRALRAGAGAAPRHLAPPPANTTHAVAAEHGMVVAQEKISARSAPTSCGAAVMRSMPRWQPALRGGDLSARRQHRRRRLHGDPFGGSRRRHRHRLSRDRAGRDDAATFSWAPTANPISPSRATPRSASAFRHAGRTGAGAGELRLRQIHPVRPGASRPIELARDGFVIADDLGDTLPGSHRRLARWPSGRRYFPAPTARRCAKATGWFSPTWRRRSRRSPNRDRAASTKARSRKSWRRRSATPAAS